MHYCLLIYEKPTDFERRNPAIESDTYRGAWRKYYQETVDAGVYVGGNPLGPPDTGTTVRLRDNKRQIQDGPYASTKEQLGGFMILELPTLDTALDWAARCPAASYGAVEVRPVGNELKDSVTGENRK